MRRAQVRARVNFSAELQLKYMMFHRAMLVLKTSRAFCNTPDAGKTFKTFVCVQRAIIRMQNAFVDKVRVL